MMNARISMEDWERLSAYLDNRLSPAEISIFENQLAEQADLRAEQQELQQLKQAFRSLPQKKAPRNYTLKSTVKTSKPFRLRFLVPAFSLGSAAAAFMLVVSFLFQFNQPAGMVEAPQAAMLEMEEDSALAATSLEDQPEIIIWGGATGMGGGGAEGLGGYTGGVGGGPAALSVEEAQPEEAARIAVDETDPEAKSPPAEEDATAKQIPEQPVTAPPDTQPNLIVGIRPTELRGQILATPETFLSEPLYSEKPSIGITFSPLQILLALLTAVFAFSAYLLARKPRQRI